MLRIFSQFAVKLAELAEAEGRLARRHASKLALVMAAMLLAAGLLLTAILLLASSLYYALAPHLGQPAALLVIGLIVLALAGIAAATAARFHKEQQ